MRCYATFVFACVLAVIAPLAASAGTIGNFCDDSHPFSLADDLSGIGTPCVVAPKSLMVETVYLQNASEVGGTALAAYPLVRFRTGLAPRVELLVDPPSQIAESTPGGAGAYPGTHFGYGLNYLLSQSGHGALALQAEVLPPTWRFAPSHGQARYVLGLTSDYQLTHRMSVGFAASGISSGTVGFDRILPSLSVRTAYDAGAGTQIATDVGSRLVTRRSVAQSFGDISVTQRLKKRVFFSAGLGTTFNAVSNAKAHYLSSGFNFRL